MAQIQPIIHVDSVEEALRFYCDGLKFTEDYVMKDDESGKAVHAGVRFENAPLMIGVGGEVAPNRGSGVVLYISMEGDLDAYFESIKDAPGLTVDHPPTDQFWEDRTFGVIDPTGYILNFAKALNGTAA